MIYNFHTIKNLPLSGVDSNSMVKNDLLHLASIQSTVLFDSTPQYDFINDGNQNGNNGKKIKQA